MMYFKRGLLIAAINLSLYGCLSASGPQETSLEGVVGAYVSGEYNPVVGAEVRLDGLDGQTDTINRVTRSLPDGTFSFLDIRPGNYILESFNLDVKKNLSIFAGFELINVEEGRNKTDLKLQKILEYLPR